MRRLLVNILVFTVGTLSFGMGNSGGNGGDLALPQDGAAWFLGKDKTIRACLVADANFGLSEKELINSVELALGKWRRYIFDKKITVASEITTTLEWAKECDGSEDLKFYFGVSDEKVGKAKLGFTEPVAFAYRENYDLKSGWGKGFIWVSPPGSVEPKMGFPNWTYPDSLQGILLHELGHVLGCSHVAETIMTEKIASLLEFFHRWRATDRIPMLTSIDGVRALYVCDSCALDYSGELKTGQLDEAYLFEILTGKDLVGVPKLVFTAPNLNDPSGVDADLTITDQKNQFKLKVKVIASTRKEFNTGIPVFKTVRFADGAISTKALSGGNGSSFSAWITAATGKNYTLELLINAGGNGVRPRLEGNEWSNILDDQGTRLFQIRGGLDLIGGETFFSTPDLRGDTTP